MRNQSSCVLLGLTAFTFAVTFQGDVHSAATRGDDKEGAEKFHARLLEIAKAYKGFGRVDDEYRWAPYLCRQPMPAVARFSASRETGTHGQKLYSLFAKDRAHYLAGKDQPAGQVLVKQSWIPKEVAGDSKQLPGPVVRQVKENVQAKGKKPISLGHFDSFVPYARKEGKLYRADKQGDLFVMFKIDPATAGTDRGWVYGTVSSDGKKVTSAGRVAACMKCHVETKGDRIFGLPSALTK